MEMFLDTDVCHNPITLLHIASYLRQRGIRPAEVFQRVGVSPSMLAAPGHWVPRDLCFELGGQAAALTGERFFGSRIGQLFDLHHLGAWGHAVVSAPNIGKACAVAARGIGLLEQGTDLHFVTLERQAQLRFMFCGKMAANPLQHLVGTLVVLRKIACMAGCSDAVSVHFSLPYARGVDALEETHGPRLEFGCEYDAIVIDREILDCATSIVCDGETAEPAETAQTVRALIKRNLPYGRCTIKAIAAEQGLSMRTLQRRLCEWGFSFEEILDDVRRTQAMEYMLAGGYSALEIAFLLGYSDQAHFSRAFKRWTGLSTREYAHTCQELIHSR